MDVEKLLSKNIKSPLLRVSTAGSVDDGKSTLIGRLLSDCKGIYDDQMEAARKESHKSGNDELGLSYLLDGLKSEREQGITIDVAYRYFSTPKRRFIIADTPGHEQYTRNMVTGASTADLAIILIDARKGMSLQSKRHGFIASLLGIPHVAVCINKMDLVDYSEERFEEIREQYSLFARKLEVSDMKFIPVSALLGDNVAHASSNMDWYKGESLLYHMESVYTASDKNMIDLRLPIQLVLRPNQDFRGFCTTVASGVVRKGDKIVVLPSGKQSRIKRIATYDGDLDYAFSPQSITIVLEDEIDVDRGDMIVHPANMPLLQSDLEAMVIWMGEEPMQVGSTYLIKHTTKTVRAVFTRLDYKIDPSELHREDSDQLLLNEIGRATLELFTPIAYDPYSRNRATGGFIIIDEKNNRTVGAGIAIERAKKSERVDIGRSTKPKSRNLVSHKSLVGTDDREQEYKQKGATIWLTGLTFAGKSTIAYGLEKILHDTKHRSVLLDGENLRHGLNRDLGFSPADRRENTRRMAEVAALLNSSGLIVIVASISPYRSDRQGACEIVGNERFIEVFVDAPLDVCKQRDDRGLYKSAQESLIPDFTGITAPYEIPEDPDIHLQTDPASEQESIETVLRYIEEKRIIW